MTDTLHKDLSTSTFVIISQLILLRMRRVAHKSPTENQNTHIMFNNIPPKNRAVCEVMREKWYS